MIIECKNCYCDRHYFVDGFNEEKRSSTTVVYIHGKVNKATRKAWHFHTIWYYRNTLSFHDVDCSTARRQLTQQPSPYTHCYDVFNTDAKRQQQAAIQRWSFYTHQATRRLHHALNSTTRRCVVWWPWGRVLRVKGGHLKPQGRGTPRTGRTLWTHWERYGGHLEQCS